MSPILRPDTTAVVRAAEALTTQVRRIADALTTTAAQAVVDAATAVQADYALAPTPVDDGPAEQCAARWHPSGPTNQLPTACIRPARHVEDHADGSGFHWTDAVAIYPAESPFVTVHAAPDLSPEAREALGALVDVAKQQMTEGRPRCTCAGVGFGDQSCTVHYPAPAADEGAPNMLRVLVDRAARGVLSEGEGEALRRRVEQIINGRATWKAKAEEIERDRDRRAAALDRLRALLSRYEHRVAVDLFEVRAALDGAEQSTTEQQE